MTAGAPSAVALGETNSSEESALRTSTVTPPGGAAVLRLTVTEVCSPPPTPTDGLDTEIVPKLDDAWNVTGILALP